MQNRSVLAEVTARTRTHMAYTAFGHLPSAPHCSSRLGFNGELLESGVHWYILGNGHRVYNTALMRFHSADTLSPFGAGGLNPYSYCSADPVNYRDPTGRFAVTILAGKVIAAVGAISAAGGAHIAYSNQGSRRALGLTAMGAGVVGTALGFAGLLAAGTSAALTLVVTGAVAAFASATAVVGVARAAPARPVRVRAPKPYSLPRHSTVSTTQLLAEGIDTSAPASPTSTRASIVPTHSHRTKPMARASIDSTADQEPEIHFVNEVISSIRNSDPRRK